jgi:penicillin-binding protein 2
MRRSYIRNSALEAEQFRRRAALGVLCVGLALAGLAAWYFKLQVLDHTDYAKKSQENRVKQRPEVPARGLIYDRKGRVLADNVPAYRLDVVPRPATSMRWSRRCRRSSRSRPRTSRASTTRAAPRAASCR